MRISQLVTESGKAGSHRETGVPAWNSAVDTRESDGATRIMIWHYDHLMFSVTIRKDGGYTINHLSIGHGSVSDQGGMNIILEQLGIRLRYRRDERGGGPRYEVLNVETQRSLNRMLNNSRRYGKRFESGTPGPVSPDLHPFDDCYVGSLR